MSSPSLVGDIGTGHCGDQLGVEMLGSDGTHTSSKAAIRGGKDNVLKSAPLSQFYVCEAHNVPESPSSLARFSGVFSFSAARSQLSHTHREEVSRVPATGQWGNRLIEFLQLVFMTNQA